MWSRCAFNGFCSSTAVNEVAGRRVLEAGPGRAATGAPKRRASCQLLFGRLQKAGIWESVKAWGLGGRQV